MGKKPPGLLPNAPVVDGAPAPIAGLQYRAVPGGGGGAGGRGGGRAKVAGLLFSTAAWFPPNGGGGGVHGSAGVEEEDEEGVQGCVQVRAVDATGAGVIDTNRASRGDGGVSGGGYLFTLPGATLNPKPQTLNPEF